MQVASVCTDKFSSVDTELLRVKKNENSSDTPRASFEQSPKTHHTEAEMDAIQEWKFFCQNQILANNLNYIA